MTPQSDAADLCADAKNSDSPLSCVEDRKVPLISSISTSMLHFIVLLHLIMSTDDWVEC